MIIFMFIVWQARRFFAPGNPGNLHYEKFLDRLEIVLLSVHEESIEGSETCKYIIRMLNTYIYIKEDNFQINSNPHSEVYITCGQHLYKYNLINKMLLSFCQTL